MRLSLETALPVVGHDLGRGGGCIFAVSHTIQCGTPKANIDAMLRALDE